ncbi:hypothetical protein H632_c4200p0, partial [Helicosporidium sp. ATCC 50920]
DAPVPHPPIPRRADGRGGGHQAHPRERQGRGRERDSAARGSPFEGDGRPAHPAAAAGASPQKGPVAGVRVHGERLGEAHPGPHRDPLPRGRQSLHAHDPQGSPSLPRPVGAAPGRQAGQLPHRFRRASGPRGFRPCARLRLARARLYAPGVCPVVPSPRAALRGSCLRTLRGRLGRGMHLRGASAAPSLVPGRLGRGGAGKDLRRAGHASPRARHLVGGPRKHAGLCGVSAHARAGPARHVCQPRRRAGRGARPAAAPRLPEPHAAALCRASTRPPLFQGRARAHAPAPPAQALSPGKRRRGEPARR